MPWAVPPSTRLFWHHRRTHTWDTAKSEMGAIRHVQEGQQKIIPQVDTNLSCGRRDLAAAVTVTDGAHPSASYMSSMDMDMDIGITCHVSFADTVDVRESPEHSVSSSSRQDSSVTSRVSFSNMVEIREIPKNRPARSRRFSSAEEKKDFAIFELQAFLQDLDLDESEVTMDDCQEEHKDDDEEPRVTSAICDVRCTPHDSVITTKPGTCRSSGSPVSPNPRLSISSRFKRVTQQANISDKLRQLLNPFGPTDFAKEKETAEVTKDDDRQHQDCLISCFATSTSKKKSSDTRKKCLISCFATCTSKKKSLYACQVYFSNTLQVFSIPQTPELDKERLFYNYDDLASFEIDALMEQQQQQDETCSKFPMPSDHDLPQPSTTAPRVSFCTDDPLVIIIPKIRDFELAFYFYRNGDIAQFRHDAWMEERLFGHPVTSFGCDTKG